jgi:hypothetical protein
LRRWHCALRSPRKTVWPRIWRNTSVRPTRSVNRARWQLKAEDEVASLHTLEQYRDEVHDMVAALHALGLDAERKPAGFKELQISLRETIRRIDDLILTMNVDKRPFFRVVRNDLFTDQNELIDELFPRKLDRAPAKSDP